MLSRMYAKNLVKPQTRISEPPKPNRNVKCRQNGDDGREGRTIFRHLEVNSVAKLAVDAGVEKRNFFECMRVATVGKTGIKRL